MLLTTPPSTGACTACTGVHIQYAHNYKTKKRIGGLNSSKAYQTEYFQTCGCVAHVAEVKMKEYMRALPLANEMTLVP